MMPNLGDASFYRIMADLSNARHPLVQISGKSQQEPGDVTLTETGRRVFEGNAESRCLERYRSMARRCPFEGRQSRLAVGSHVRTACRHRSLNPKHASDYTSFEPPPIGSSDSNPSQESRPGRLPVVLIGRGLMFTERWTGASHAGNGSAANSVVPLRTLSTKR